MATGEVVRLARLGLSNTEIAEVLEVPRNRVGVQLFHARLRGEKIPKLSKHWVGLTEDERALLNARAAEAGVPANWLARQLIVRVLSEGLVAVVLGGEPGEVFNEDT